MTFAPQAKELAGTIQTVLTRDIVKRVYNDGDRMYLTLRQEARNSLPITADSTAIIVPLTNPNLDFIQFDQSFITLMVDITYKLEGFEGAKHLDRLPPASTVAADDQNKSLTDLVAPNAANPVVLLAGGPPALGDETAYDTNVKKNYARYEQSGWRGGAEGIAYFIGLKNSSDCIGEYAVYHKGKQVNGTLQSNATVESFLYHTFRAEEDLMHRPNEHSVASAVRRMDTLSACGEFRWLNDIQKDVDLRNGEFTLHHTINIPFNDILCFQQFRSYPAALFGDLELRMKFNANAFVSMICDPQSSAEKMMTSLSIRDWAGVNKTFSANAISWDSSFVQVRDTFTGITHCSVVGKVLTMTSKADLSITPKTLRINQVFSTLTGYRANPANLEGMRALFEKSPWVKFSQNINYLPFSMRADTSGFNIVQQTYLNNTTDLILLFPETEHQSQGTCFKNPELTELSLTIMNRKYPENGIDTISPEYVHTILSSTDRNAKPELLDSILRARWMQFTTTTGSLNLKYVYDCDLTSFVCAIKVERPTAMGLICDGLDSKGFQTPIRLTAKPKFTNCTEDLYCRQAANHPPPILVTVNDSFWLFNSKDGGECLYSARPFNKTVDLFMGQDYGD